MPKHTANNPGCLVLLVALFLVAQSNDRLMGVLADNRYEHAAV